MKKTEKKINNILSSSLEPSENCGREYWTGMDRDRIEERLLIGERGWARSTWAQARLPRRGNLWRGGDQHPDDRRPLDEEYQRLHRAAGNLHPRGKNGRCVQPSNDILRKLRIFSLFLSLGKESKLVWRGFGWTYRVNVSQLEYFHSILR